HYQIAGDSTMPGYHTHDIITVVTGAVLAPLTSVALIAAGEPPQSAYLCGGILFAAHLLSGMMFSPDLDLDSRIDHRWGLFYWIWRPYVWALPHRSFWSHGLILPPLLRLAYFYLVAVILMIAAAWVLGKVGIAFPDYHERVTGTLLGIVHNYPRQTYWFMMGFVTGGAVHSIADWLVTDGKHILHHLGIHLSKDYTNHDRHHSHA